MNMLSRRDFLKVLGVGTAGTAAALALAACNKGEGGGTSGGGSSSGGGKKEIFDVIKPASENPVENASFPAGRINPEGFENDWKSSKDTLVFRLDEDNGNLDNVGGGTFIQSMIVFCFTGETMFTEGYDKDGNLTFVPTKYAPVESYEFDSDYMGITFKVRDGVVFHDGSTMTVDDLEWSLRRFQPNSRYDYIDWDNIKQEEGNKLYVPFTRIRADLMAFFGRSVRIFSKKLSEEAEAAGNHDYWYVCPGTCGQYKITEWVSGDHVSLVANEKFYGGAPKIKNVTIRFISDPTVGMMELETGGLDILYGPAWNDVKNVINGDYGDKIAGFEDLGDMLMMLGMNCGNSPCKDKNLRQFILHAIDWKTVEEGSWEGLGALPKTFMTACFENLLDCSDWWLKVYNPDLAKEYLDKTEYKNGGLKLVILISSEPQKQTMCELMNTNLSKFGVTLDIQTFDTATYAAKMQSPDGWDLWLRDWGGTGVWANFFTPTGFVKNTHSDIGEPEMQAEMEALGVELLATLDPAKKVELGHKLQENFFDFHYDWLFPTVQAKNFILYTSKLHAWSKTAAYYYMADAYFE